MIILAQKYLEFCDQSLKAYQDVTRKADIWQAVSVENCAPAELVEPKYSSPFYVHDGNESYVFEGI